MGCRRVGLARQAPAEAISTSLRLRLRLARSGCLAHLPARDGSGERIAALEWRANPSSSWILQSLLLDDVTTQLASVGRHLRRDARAGGEAGSARARSLEIALIENAVYFGTSPDFGIHLALRQGF